MERGTIYMVADDGGHATATTPNQAAALALVGYRIAHRDEYDLAVKRANELDVFAAHRLNQSRDAVNWQRIADELEARRC